MDQLIDHAASARRVVRRLLAAVVAAVAVLVAFQFRPTNDGPTGSFCQTYGDLDRDVAQIERVLAGKRVAGDQSIDTLRGVVGLVWSDRVAHGGPDATDADAEVVARAVRTAVSDDDLAPLHSQSVLDAVERLGPRAARACDGESP